MGIDFYYSPLSPSCRAVLLTAKVLGIELNLKLVNTREGEQLKPNFLKMNPQHTVPTIDDNGFYLWESRAIMTYLVNKFSRSDALYSKEPKRRAIIDQRLYFDATKLYPNFYDCYSNTFATGAEPAPEKLKQIHETMELFEIFLDQTGYAADDQLTVADISLVTMVSSCPAVDFDLSQYKNVSAWLEKMKKELPGYEEINGTAVQETRKIWEQQTKNK